MTKTELRQAALTLPYEPGVYIMKDASGKVIYVGKAKRLKNRVSQYFQDSASHNEKTRRMVSQIHSFDTIAAATEFEALVLECSLIKRHMPKYNILLKDGKGYPFLRLDLRDPYPRLTLSSHSKDDGARYFGPFGSRGRTNLAIAAMQETFRLPDCNRKFPRDVGKERPCLNYQMKKCDGWCRPALTQREYRARIEQLLLLLEGKHRTLSDALRKQMEDAAEHLEFETAALLRDRLHAIEALGQRQLVTAGKRIDTDVIGWYQTEAKLCFAVLHFIGGNLVDKDFELLPATQDDREVFSSLVKQYYLARKSAPRRVLLSLPMDDAQLFEQLLAEQMQIRTSLRTPQRGEGRQLVELADKNAREEAQRATTASERISGTLLLLQSMLSLPQIPRRLEAYDISNTAGTDIVASMTVFADGKPKRSDYKRFKLENMEEQDDYAAMRQVLCRRFCHYLDGDKGFDEAPDALLIDGGAVHAQTVRAALLQMGVDLPIFGMVKDGRHRTRALVTPDGEEIGIQGNTAVFSLIGRIQEETHRFAITYHRSLRSRRVRSSALDGIAGIGDKRKTKLLKHFQSVSAIRGASVEELQECLPRSAAQAVYDYFHQGAE
ncbi:MAG: excinuclease ABC subunit UvrC [Oscillospiraceae bacterium]|jgi:excinuclease ABC subunit C|nr:excinuclease ABC subunit UvrC [Oscillospiraceae bacterium]